MSWEKIEEVIRTLDRIIFLPGTLPGRDHICADAVISTSGLVDIDGNTILAGRPANRRLIRNKDLLLLPDDFESRQ